MNNTTPRDTVPQGVWKWVTPAIVLMLTVYLVQLTARLATDEALLQTTATLVKERTPLFENMIRMESKIAVVESEMERRKPLIDQIPVFNQEQVGLHAAINERISRIAQILDRLEAQLEDLIKEESAAHNRLESSTDFRALRPHYSTPDSDTPRAP